MARYLTFALVAPMASFGGIAVGERRSGWDRPARSAVLGLVAACLGLERGDERQAMLADDVGLALLCLSPGRLLADFHTAQVPSRVRGRRHSTRAAELAEPELNTVLSRRDYRSDAWHLAALWLRREPAGWTLEALRDAMERPAFTLSLGRKSCPLGLPLAPRVDEAVDAPAALVQRRRDGPEARLVQRGRPLFDRLAGAVATDSLVVAMDAPDEHVGPGDAGYLAPDDSRRRRVERRRDQPRDRWQWQFDLRSELVLEVGPAAGSRP